MNWLSRRDHGDITKSILSFIFAAFIRPFVPPPFTATYTKTHANSKVRFRRLISANSEACYPPPTCFRASYTSGRSQKPPQRLHGDAAEIRARREVDGHIWTDASVIPVIKCLNVLEMDSASLSRRFGSESGTWKISRIIRVVRKLVICTETG
jgi:hypothetical protein